MLVTCTDNEIRAGGSELWLRVQRAPPRPPCPNNDRTFDVTPICLEFGQQTFHFHALFFKFSIVPSNSNFLTKNLRVCIRLTIHALHSANRTFLLIWLITSLYLKLLISSHKCSGLAARACAKVRFGLPWKVPHIFEFHKAGSDDSRSGLDVTSLDSQKEVVFGFRVLCHAPPILRWIISFLLSSAFFFLSQLLSVQMKCCDHLITI